MESIFEIKKNAIENHVPIILDDTLDTIEGYINQRKSEGIYINRILEIGTAVGYSALIFSNFLEDDGRIDTLERDENMINQAIENIKLLNDSENNHGKFINLIQGDASEILPTFDPSENEKYDMVFIDANKSKYPFYLEQALRLMKPNGIIFADNILYKGYVMSDYNLHKQRTAVRHIREFIKMAEEDKNLNTKILEVGDGLGVITRK